MLLIFLEAMLALALFILLVWWTMFSGRKRGELPTSTERGEDARAPTKAPHE